jgi:molybdopterin synthase sulfur carrier subunit
MPIAFHIPGPLRAFTQGSSTVEVAARVGNVRDALEALCALYPGVRDRVLTEQGEVREHVNVFVGSEHIRYTGGLATAVADGTEISIVAAVSGGANPPRRTNDRMRPRPRRRRTRG